MLSCLEKEFTVILKDIFRQSLISTRQPGLESFLQAIQAPLLKSRPRVKVQVPFLFQKGL